MINEKQPSAGEWWRSRCGKIRYVICDLRKIRPDNDDPFPILSIDRSSDSESVISHMEDGREDSIDSNNDLIEHLPLCDSFTWKPAAPIDPGEGFELLPRGTVLEDGDEFSVDGGKSWIVTCNPGSDKVRDGTYRRRKPVETWPKYVIGDGWSDTAYLIHNGDSYRGVNPDGTKRDALPWTEANTEMITKGIWRYITEAEALARVKPVESPDDWVDITDPEHVLRYCDEMQWHKDGSWHKVTGYVGRKLSSIGEWWTAVRCRRRDLPPQPRLKRTDTFGRDVTEEYGLHDETDIVTKCIPVRLWVRREMRSDSGRYYVSLKISPPSDGFTYDEIKIGPDGFYVESNTNDG